MDIKEIFERAETLEKQITGSINHFREETGMAVTSVDITTHRTTLGEITHQHAVLTIELNKGNR